MSRECTCLGTCRGAEGLAPGWRCALAPLAWTCRVCGAVHPVDHAGMFCGVCMDMVACVSCERAFKQQCHVKEGAEVITERSASFVVTMAVVYTNPRDLAPGFAVRLLHARAGVVAPGALLGEGLADLKAARELVPAGMVNIGTMPGDDPGIAEVWL